MVDTIDPIRRSWNMSRIRGRDTKPELRLRSALHHRGLRYRVCRSDLPGKPDIVFSRQRLAIQVRGCFWHQHEGCDKGRLPKSNVDYWKPKLEGNSRRDGINDRRLHTLGWRVLVFWECELLTQDAIVQAVERVCRNLRLAQQ